MKNEHDFAALFSGHFDKVYNLCRRIGVSSSAAQDIAQDVFLRYYESSGDFRGDSKPSTWLYRVAVNCCIDHLRREARWQKKRSDMSHLEGSALNSSDDVIVDSAVGMQILKKLSPRNRSLLVLRSYLDLSYQEIAAVLGMKAESVGVQLTRARREAVTMAGEMGVFDEM
jgi:RNA polymerase sigma-70 factor (ECF subfamily)